MNSTSSSVSASLTRMLTPAAPVTVTRPSWTAAGHRPGSGRGHRGQPPWQWASRGQLEVTWPHPRNFRHVAQTFRACRRDLWSRVLQGLNTCGATRATLWTVCCTGCRPHVTHVAGTRVMRSLTSASATRSQSPDTTQLETNPSKLPIERESDTVAEPCPSFNLKQT